MPTSTDLVTDLPADFETFGQAVDTSLADLKGGTTGQILSKASNTDMDFTWVANDVGDITAVTAGTGITGGGTSGAVTVSFDQANFGGGQYAAGKNKIINGDFNIWQRGTSINIGVGAYWADRYSMDMIAAVPTGTASRQAFTPGTAPVAGYEGNYFGRINVTAHNNSTLLFINQKIENVTTFAGQTITVSAFIKADAATNIGANLVQNFGSGGSGAVVTSISSSTNITTGWVRYSWSVAVPSISGKTIGTGSSLEIRFNIPTTGGFVRVGTYDFWGVQVEAGSTATPFQTAMGTIQGELAACQRYYFRTQPAASTRYTTGMAKTTTTTDFVYSYPVTMRTSPSALEQSGTAGDYGVLYQATGAVCSAVPVIVAASNAAITITFTVAAGLTAGNATIPYAVNATGYLGWSAEL